MNGADTLEMPYIWVYNTFSLVPQQADLEVKVIHLCFSTTTAICVKLRKYNQIS